MNLERWEEIKNTIRKSFTVEEEGSEDLFVETAEGRLKQGEAEFFVFQSPMGKTKLELRKKPRLEEKKFHFSHRAGAAARVEYKHSETELVYTLKAYRWDDVEDDWKEIEAGKISNF